MQQLILNAFPNHFKFNSVYAAQPFYTPAQNKKTFKKLGKLDQFSFEEPVHSHPLIPIVSHPALKTVLKDKQNFHVPWGAKMPSLYTYMLANDSNVSATQRTVVSDMLYGNSPTHFTAQFAKSAEAITRGLLEKESYALGRNGARQVDIVAR